MSVPTIIDTPLLDGSSGIAVLAFGVALSVYLRNVSNDTQKNIENMLSDKDRSIWSADEKLFSGRLNLLRQTRLAIEKVTPFMFGFSVFVGIRISTFQFPKGMAIFSFRADVVRLLDASILTSLTLAIAWMWISHTRLKRTEKKIT